MTAAAAPARDELARSRGYLTLLSDLMEDFSQARIGDAAFATSALTRVASAMDAEAASLWLLEGEAPDPHARLVCTASVGPSSIVGLSIPLDRGIIGRCLSTGTAQLIADPQADPDFVHPPTLGVPFTVKSLMCAPLAAMGRRVGVVEVVNRLGGDAFNEQDLDILAALAAAAGLAVVNAQMAEEHAERQRLQRELALAATVQRDLLPRDVPADAAIHGFSRPARGVSGDFYDMIRLPDGRTVFALADVSGKGMNAALIMVKAATLFRTWGRRLPEPGRLLARIESELCETMSLGMFVTMVVGVWDPATRCVQLANAGHEPPLLRAPDGTFTAFPAADPPLGIVCQLENNRYRETAIDVGRGALYLYTDGATEGRIDGEAAGETGVRALIERHAADPAGGRLEAIAAHYGDELRDDLTWLVIEDAACATQAVKRAPRRRGGGLLVSQSLPAQPDQLKIVRRLVEAAARQAGAGAEWASDLAMAVDEACQNIIRHGYRGAADGRIELSIRRKGGALAVELCDTAPSVAEGDCRGRALDDVRPGGLGTFFMQRLTDGVRFLSPRGGSGNRLLLTKKLRE
ncbi:MAG TPA: SpoIIE family protein phosphatase [Nevskiaceae bacterium]|nr:SpoIIE family protein phosphatase [Nevskiaceae bacterium]